MNCFDVFPHPNEHTTATAAEALDELQSIRRVYSPACPTATIEQLSPCVAEQNDLPGSVARTKNPRSPTSQLSRIKILDRFGTGPTPPDVLGGLCAELLLMCGRDLRENTPLTLCSSHMPQEIVRSVLRARGKLSFVGAYRRNSVVRERSSTGVADSKISSVRTGFVTQ